MPAQVVVDFWENVFCDLLIVDSFKYRLLSSYRRSFGHTDQPLIQQEASYFALVLPLNIGGFSEKEGLDALQDLADFLFDLVQGNKEEKESKEDWELKDQVEGLIGRMYIEGFDYSEVQRAEQDNPLSSKLLPWTVLLSNFTKDLGQQERKLSKRRPSKRYKEGSGQRWVRRASLSVLLDVSASISEASLNIFMTALDGLLSRGHSIRLFQVDDRIRSVSDYRLGYRPALKKGGGTRFNKAIEQIVKEYDQDGLLIFTDGLLQEQACAVSIPHLWILDKDRDLPFDFGIHRVFLSNET